MTTIYFCCEYNDDEKMWLVTVPGDKGPAKGIGGSLEEAIADWKESLTIASIVSAQLPNMKADSFNQ